jgi:hypothetical protein
MEAKVIQHEAEIKAIEKDERKTQYEQNKANPAA